MKKMELNKEELKERLKEISINKIKHRNKLNFYTVGQVDETYII